LNTKIKDERKRCGAKKTRRQIERNRDRDGDVLAKEKCVLKMRKTYWEVRMSNILGQNLNHIRASTFVVSHSQSI